MKPSFYFWPALNAILMMFIVVIATFMLRWYIREAKQGRVDLEQQVLERTLGLREQTEQTHHAASLKNKAVPLKKHLNRWLSKYKFKAKQRNIDYLLFNHLDISQYFNTDLLKLESIVKNILLSAFSRASENGCVTVSVKLDPHECLLIKVSSTGNGKGQRGTTYSKDVDDAPHGEAGAELFIIKNYISMMGGTFNLKCREDQGSTIIAKIPAQMAHAPVLLSPVPSSSSPVEKTLTREMEAPDVSTAEYPSVLIACTNYETNELLGEILSDSYHIHVANDGVEAWQQLEKEEVDIVITEIQMPKMDGFDLIEKIKKTPLLNTLPIVVLSDNNTIDVRLKAFSLGIDDYVSIPFDERELKAVLDRLLLNAKLRIQNTPSGSTDNDGQLPSECDADHIWLKELEAAAWQIIDDKQTLRIKDISKHLFISERQLQRRVKELTGLTPNQYLKEARLQKARGLLEKKAYNSVSAVAMATGFNSSSYFAKSYSKRFGRPPSAYLQPY